MQDVDHQISAVRRRVGTRMLEAGEARVLTISQTYAAPVDDVWDAITSPERLPRWFAPVSGDLREGGRYQIEGNASGTVTSCDPPSAFTATWEYGGDVSWIEVSVVAEPAGTRLELVHIAHIGDDFWDRFGPGAMGVGYDLAFMGLAAHLSTGADITPDEAERWSLTEEGRRFIGAGSDRWRQASVDAGTDPGAAGAAAERTTAFYTGAETPEEQG